MPPLTEAAPKGRVLLKLLNVSSRTCRHLARARGSAAVQFELTGPRRRPMLHGEVALRDYEQRRIKAADQNDQPQKEDGIAEPFWQFGAHKPSPRGSH